jgi:hypothetical protein
VILRESDLEFDESPVRFPGRYEVVEATLLSSEGRIRVVVKKTRTVFYEKPGRTRADRSAAVARELIARGVPTPEPIGVAHEGGESWYVSRRLEGAVQIREWFLHRDDPGRGAPRLRIPFDQVVAALGRLARRMHDQGVFFRDFSDGNILVTRDGAGFRLSTGTGIGSSSLPAISIPNRCRLPWKACCRSSAGESFSGTT